VFADRGFHASAMDDIAGAAGVTKPVLYQHFASKRALFVEVLRDVGSQLLARLDAATGEATTGRARVQAGFAAYFHFVTENEHAFRVLFGAAARNDPEFAVIVDGVLEAVADAISQLIEIEGTVEHRRVLAHAVIGMAEATSRDALTADGATPEPDRLAAWVAELAWFGLRGVRAD
jgi:AcrR family transcriptional regulator